MKSSAGKSYVIAFIITALLALAAAIIIPTVTRVCSYGHKNYDAFDIRQIAMTGIIYAADHSDRFPEATHVWDFAYQLAASAGLDDASMWQSKQDPAFTDSADVPRNVLIPGNTRPRQLDPRFRQLKPSIAVPLGKLTTSMPTTTPIAWTRGLQTDGTWAKHSPYGGKGGYIAFVGGNVAYYTNLKSDDGGQLIRYDRKGQTANILEALPPGTRIGEYTPTPEEQKSWAP
jgi:hypothetical protein